MKGAKISLKLMTFTLQWGISNLLYYQTTFYLSVICFSNIAEYGTFHGVKIKNRIRLGLERKKKDHCRQHLF